MDLSTLKFNVETKALEQAVKLVDDLNKGMQQLGKQPPPKFPEPKTPKAPATPSGGGGGSPAKTLSILEKQKSILGFVNEGYTKSQATILTVAKAAGIADDEFQELTRTVRTLSKVMGENPFDKSNDGLRAMTVQLGQAKEGYRQLTYYTKEYEKLKAEGAGKETSLVGLNRKETDQLYRDKLRSFELFKQTRDARKQELELELEAGTRTRESINKTLHAEKHLFKERLRAQEAQYKSVATQKRPLDELRTVDATKRANELRYLARATSVQLGDIGISLAGGQNPLTVFLQQGDQLRGVFNQVGADAGEMKKALSGAFGQIVAGFKDVALTLVSFVGTAFVDAGKAVAGYIAQLTGIPFILDKVVNGFKVLGFETNGLGKDSGFAKFLTTISPAVIGGITFGILGLASAAIAVGVAYAKILPVQKELNAALIQNGASLATSAKDAMQMSAAMAGASGTSLDYAKVITEIASAGNLSKDSIQGITNSAVEMNRYLGTATKDVVAQYSKLADDPVKALTEIGMATGRVTSATIDHIKSLVEQGKKTEAVALANKELDRTYAEMSGSAKDSMTPLSRLWDDIKGGINQAIEAVYAFAQTDSVINGLTTVWESLKVSIMEVSFVIRGIGRELGGLAAQASAIANGYASGGLADIFRGGNFLEGIKSAGRIGDMMKADADDARKAQDAATAAVINHNSELAKGISVNNLITQAQLDAQKATGSAIKGSLAWEEKKKEYSTASRLDSKARVDAINKEKTAAKALFEEQKKSLIGQGARGEIKPEAAAKKLNSLKQDLDSFNFAIEEKYKAKKGAGGDSAARDALSAEQQSFENLRKQAERNAKTKQADLESARNLELVNSYMFIDEKYAIDKEYIEKSIQLLSQEMNIASKKKNSLKEVAEFQGKIQAEKDKLDDRSLERQRALAEHSGKAAIEMRNAAMQEIATLVEKNKAQKLDNELIGKTQEEIAGIKAARLDHVIALQQEHVEYMKKNGYNETSSTAYGLEKEKLDALVQSRKLNTEALTAETLASIAKTNAVSSESFNKESGNLDILQKDLDFREKLLGKTQEQKEEMKRAYELEKQLQESKLKQQEAINEATAEYNRLISSGAENTADIKASFDLKLDRINSLAQRQEDLIKGGAVAAKKELVDAELSKFSSGIADALVTGMTQGAKAGKKKLRDLIVAELTKTITLNIQANIQTLLSGSGGSSGGGIFDKILDKGIDYLTNSLFGGAAGGTAASTAASTFGAVTGTAGTYGMSTVAGTGAAALAELTTGVATLGASAATATTATVAAGTGVAGMATAALAAIPVVGWVAAGVAALFAIFGNNEDKIPTVINDLALFNNSLIGLPFLDLAIGSDEAAQGLRDVLYGLENASPTMRKLAGETVSLSVELLRATGDIAGAANLARNLGTRGMSEAEIAVYDYNQSLRDQIDAARAGASASREAAQAEEQLAQTRYDLAGKLNILLGRTTQKEFDRATQLASTSDAASIEMMKLIFQLEDLTSVVDAAYATLERSIAAEYAATEKAINAERKLADVRLQSATALQSALKAAKEATSPRLTRATAQANLKVLLALAKSTGILPSADALKPSLDALSEPSEGLFSNFVDYQRDFLRTAKDIDDLSRITDKQVSIEQQTIDKLDAQLIAAKEQHDAQLASAKAQLDALRGVDTSVKDVATAVKDFNKAMQDLAEKKTTTGAYTYSPPILGGGGSGGGGTSGGGSSAAKPVFEDIVGQTNKDIVAAYREYYNRNPDESGYEFFSKSLLTGDKLMQAILGASAGNPNSADYKMALSKGYDPTNPIAKYLKSILNPTTNDDIGDMGSFAVGINNVPEDMNARIHKGERILPAADNRELFARLKNPDENAAVLAKAVERLTREVEGLRMEQRQTTVNTGDTSKMLRRLGGEEDVLTVKVQA